MMGSLFAKATWIRPSLMAILDISKSATLLQNLSMFQNVSPFGMATFFLAAGYSHNFELDLMEKPNRLPR